VTEYVVRFSLRVTADGPGDAVDGVVDLFVEKGLRDWVYRVDDPSETNSEKALVGFFDGYGDPVDVDELLSQVGEPAPIPVQTAELPDPPAISDDDADLLAEAESLNQS
jgi:hypothetical protein